MKKARTFYKGIMPFILAALIIASSTPSGFAVNISNNERELYKRKNIFRFLKCRYCVSGL